MLFPKWGKISTKPVDDMRLVEKKVRHVRGEREGDEGTIKYYLEILSLEVFH